MPDITVHPSARALALFHDGKLPEAQAATVAAHLAVCADCRRAAGGAPHGATHIDLRTPPPAATPAESSLPPELVQHPKFLVLRELGRGGMGVVYLAEHRVMHRPVAIKVISNNVLTGGDAPARLQAEVRAAARLDHENIVRAFDAEHVGSLHLLVMEFVDGPDLATLLKRSGPLPVADACRYAQQAALGLQHAFERGMVHRDIKPQNLVLTPEGRVKILDFGLARVRSEQGGGTRLALHDSLPGAHSFSPPPHHGAERSRLTQQDAFLGTPEYVAPEQAVDARKADTRSDIYSLGCTLYALLAGRPPFAGETAVHVVLAHIEHEPRPLLQLRPEVPASLSAIVARMMAKDPAKRYQTPLEAVRALAPFCRADAPPRPVAASPAGAGVLPAWMAAVDGAGHLPPVRGGLASGERGSASDSPREEGRQERMPPARARAKRGRGIQPERGDDKGRAEAAEPGARHKVRLGLMAGAIVGAVVLLVLGVLSLGSRPDSPRAPRPNAPGLPPEKGAGAILIKGLRPGDRVFLDGRQLPEGPAGAVGEMRLPAEEGDHQLEVKRVKHHDWSALVTVWAGQREPSVVVRPEKLKGVLLLTGLRPGDRVLLDGVRLTVDSFSDRIQRDVEEGECQVRVERADHHPWERAVAVTAGETASVKVALVKTDVPSPPPEIATLIVKVDAPDARVLINGIQRNSTLITLPAGLVRVTAEKEGFESEHREIELIAGLRRRVEIALKPLALRSSEGNLTLTLKPAGVSVFIDGNDAKLTVPKDGTPLTINLPEGKHQLKVSKPGYEDETTEVTISQARPATRTVALRLLAPEIVKDTRWEGECKETYIDPKTKARKLQSVHSAWIDFLSRDGDAFTGEYWHQFSKGIERGVKIAGTIKKGEDGRTIIAAKETDVLKIPKEVDLLNGGPQMSNLLNAVRELSALHERQFFFLKDKEIEEKHPQQKDPTIQYETKLKQKR